MKTAILIALALAATSTMASAQTTDNSAPDVDWKFIGTAKEQTWVCFYDTNGVIKLDNGHYRAWSKCISQIDINKIDDDSPLGKELIDRAAHAKLNNKETDTMVLWVQQVANFGQIEDQSKTLFEVSCQDKMYKLVSVHIKTMSEAPHSVNDPWQYIAPQTNVARLHRFLCSPTR
jgi:hypothetical protein